MNDKQQRFIEWLATPLEDREPQTQKELSLKLGVSEPQLSDWKRELGLVPTKQSDITALREHIISEAKKAGNAQMARLAWDIMNPKNEEKKEADFTADEYINIGLKIIEQLRNSYRESGGVCPVCDRPQTLRGTARLDTEQEQQED